MNSSPLSSSSKTSPVSAQLKPIARWNPARGVWETDRVNLFCGHSEPYRETWPAWGIVHDGVAYSLPRPEHLTAGNESLSGLFGTPTSRDYKGVPGKNVQMASLPRDVSLLPTPTHHDEKNEMPLAGRKRNNRGKMIDRGEGDLTLPGAIALLPTPNAFDAHLGDMNISEEAAELQLRRGDPNGSRRNTTGSLAKEIKLLPTPNTMDNLPPKTREQIQKHRDDGKGGDRNLREAVLYEIPSAAENSPRVDFGKYEPAVRRWEPIIGRKAPNPREPATVGLRLSPLFTEWLMGLPEGHVTGTGISRKAQLHVLGNGVVPQQAELALRILLDERNFT